MSDKEPTEMYGISLTDNNERRLFGPPGTGKTSFLKRETAAAVDKYGADQVLVASYTRAAAATLVSRDLGVDRDAIGTLHALCYRDLGSPEIAERHIEEFNEAFPQYRLSSGVKGSLDENAGETFGVTDADKLFTQYRLHRAKMLPLKTLQPLTIGFVKAWESWKGDNKYLDFTDMIDYTFRHQGPPPGGRKVGLYDEAQDFNRLEMALVRMWAQHQEYIILAGDDDQCSIAGTKVLTRDGYIPIEDLQPGKHRLVSYYKDKSEIVGDCLRNFSGNGHRKGPSGFDFEIRPHHYCGQVIGVSAENKITFTTPDHIWPVKWTPQARGSYVVYMMEKNGRFRIGHAAFIRADGCFNFGVRCRMENADRGWILKVFNNLKDACLWEPILSIRYGIPQVLFNEPDMRFVKHRTYLDTKQIEKFWTCLDVDTKANAMRCLQDFGLLYEYPLWIKNHSSKFGEKILRVRAANLLPGVMAVASYNGKSKKGVSWNPASVTRKHYDGLVYGINVEPHHHYIADGLITHNCLYGFAGASSDSFLNPPIPQSQKRVLSQSWRIPHSVHRLASTWISQIVQREPKEYRPRDVEGEVRRARINHALPQRLLQDAQQYLQEGKSVMFLASCGYMLDRLKSHLREQGQPFHNPFKKNRGDWNPLGDFGKYRRDGVVTSKDRLLAYLDASGPAADDGNIYWPVAQLAMWVEVINSKGLLKHGAKTRIADQAEFPTFYSPEEIAKFHHDNFEEGALREALARDLSWLKRNLMSAKAPVLDFPIKICEKHGQEKLNDKPQIILSTIHGVKGGEADVCYVFPDMSLQGLREWQQKGEGHDAVVRMFYVGMTRAKESLVLCDPATPLHVKL